MTEMTISTTVEVFERPASPDKPLTAITLNIVPADQKPFLSFNVRALSFSKGENCQFSFMSEGTPVVVKGTVEGIDTHIIQNEQGVTVERTVRVGGFVVEDN